MKMHHLSLLLLLSMFAVQAGIAGPEDGTKLIGASAKERIRIEPGRRNSETPSADAKGSALPLQAPEKDPSPTRHIWGDLDEDGLSDLFVLDADKNLLFRNLGDGGFEDVTALAFPDGAGSGGIGFMGDYNGDELMDLFVFHEEGFTLYRNEGKLRFSDATAGLGLPSKLKAAQVQLKDYDGDGFQDLLVNSAEGDRIFRNRKGREFREVVPNRTGTTGSNMKSSVPPIQNPGGPAGPNAGTSGMVDATTLFLNDNSPDSVGAGVPEVEGGDDASVQNDIVDGTVTGADILNSSITAADIKNGTLTTNDIKNETLTGTDIADESVTGADIQDLSLTGSEIADGSMDPNKVIGTAATLKGDQSFDKGTFFIDSVNDCVGIGTTSHGNASLHVDSDETYGCRIATSTSAGRAVYGSATSATGITYGVRGESASTSGRGVYGTANASTGTNYGVRGHSSSSSGRGVYGSSPYIGLEGSSTATSGTRYGIYGESASTSGRGVYGTATATNGTTYGVQGECASTAGRGVYGISTASTGINYGIRGESSSTSGRGVYGWASASSGTTYGVKGESSSDNGRGVYGSGEYIGVQGHSTGTVSGDGNGVHGSSSAFVGCGVYGEGHYGVRGESDYMGVCGMGELGVLGMTDFDTGIAVEGFAVSSDVNYGVKGFTSSAIGYGVYSMGDFGGTGSKYFIQPHPYDPGKEIRFVCLEGNESGTYFRGSSTLENGRAVIEVPEEFRLVTEEDGLTVQVTPLDLVRICVEEYSLDRIVIRGEADVEFHYFVNGVRKGFAGHEPIRENHAWVPEYKDRPYGTQYPEALRKILVQNGTLNPDYTPNKKTAARMGWELRDWEKEGFLRGNDRESKPLDLEDDLDHKVVSQRVEGIMKRRRSPDDLDRPPLEPTNEVDSKKTGLRR